MKRHPLVPVFVLVVSALPAQFRFHEDFTAKTLNSAWTWSDPGNDCKYQLGALPGRLRSHPSPTSLLRPTNAAPVAIAR